MRLWTLHPKYLDPQGLVALWRESLLARAVLRGETRGYRHHPQLARFQQHPAPLAAINAYLTEIYTEALTRSYRFDKSKLVARRSTQQITATTGQIAYEWQHLLNKLKQRNPDYFQRWHTLDAPDPHLLFAVVPGAIAAWERPAPKK